MFTDKPKARPAASFVDDDSWKKKVISKIEDGVNGTTRFAITKLTAGGKWMRGNLLFYCLNGVEIYTDPNNIIFVDTENNTLFIREHEKVQEQLAPQNPESKQYIILYVDLGYNEENLGEEEFPLRWESVTGRINAYENIKINAPVIDIDRSLILAESVPLKDAFSVRQFMEYLKNSEIINDESFDINDYAGSEYL
jgi:hypothetical protein